MARSVFGESVRGASHIRGGRECQDSMKKVERDENTVILAVADGHGSEACPYSRTGADIAVNVFCRIMEDYLDTYAERQEMLLTFFKREGDTKVAQAVEAEWKRRVLKAHANNKREFALDADGNRDREAVYRLYGSTLLGLVLTEEFLFAFQLGDGDIVEVSRKGVQHVIEADKILGTETHSLSRPEAWRRALSCTARRDGKPRHPLLYMLSTDGMANSYKNGEEFYKTCRDYYALLQKHGVKAVAESLKGWLAETSELGCGDDVTALCAYLD